MSNPGSATSTFGTVRWILLAFLALWLIFTCMPIYFLLITAMKPVEEINRMVPTFWPEVWQPSNFAGIFVDPGSVKSLVDSLIVAISNTALSLLLGTLAGYALARFLKGPVGENLSFWILSNRMFPPVAVLIPMFFLFDATPWGTDSYLSLIILYLVFNLPLATWLMMVFFRDAPVELEEAAYIDGWTPLRAFTRITLPLVFPGMISVAMLCFIFAWNEYLFANLLDRHRGQDLPGAHPDLHPGQPDAVEPGDGVFGHSRAAAHPDVHPPAPLHGPRPVARRGQGLMALLEVEGLCKAFDEVVLDRMSFSVERGEFFVIVGPSGIGKTTTLRLHGRARACRCRCHPHRRQ